MKIGCPKEIKPQEFRVGMTPNAAREAANAGHAVMIETNAGAVSYTHLDVYKSQTQRRGHARIGYGG